MSNYFENIQDGISQFERQLDALRPDYVKVDDRSTFDLLAQLAALSDQFNFYNSEDKPDGDWQDFFYADLVVMLIIASNLEFTAYEEEYLRIREAMGNTEEDTPLRLHTARFFTLLYDMAIVLMNVLQQLSLADKKFILQSYTQQMINAVEEEVDKLYRFELQAASLFPDQPAQQTTLRSPQVTPDLLQLFPRSFRNTDEGTEVFKGFYSLNEIYDTLRSKFYQISSASGYYLNKQLTVREHEPHMGLLVTFTELYKHLQTQINELPKRHLDYYFREILGIQQLHAVPDQVHILVEPAPQITKLTIEAGEILLAANAVDKEPLKYQLLEQLTVHPARIMAMHTLYVSRYLQIAARPLQSDDIFEAEVYSATHAVIPPAAYAKLTTPPLTWPLLGEDQHDLSQAMRTMDNSSLGFLIGSPALYLTEGHREVQVKLHFTPATFSIFKSYINNYAVAAKRSVPVITNELLSAAFLLYYTTAKTWTPVQYYNVRSSAVEQADNAIAINFILHMNAEASSTYKEEVHGDNIASSLPLLKILLNNNSFHHPYSFLRYLVLERVTVTANVDGYHSVKLSNNIGEANAAHAFRMFGSMPVVGSYLDICDTNIFNKYTRDFSINLEWLDLPKDINGFDSYYAAYQAGMTTDAYKVGISSINNGQFLPDNGDQQLFPLFQTYRDKEGDLHLDDTTVIGNADFHKISFPNAMKMAKDEKQGNNTYKEGTVRLELATPSEAFGHLRYPLIFPDIIQFNAKHPSRKKPLPNLPYVPSVKSIQISYTLVHSESVKPVRSSNRDEGLEVHHFSAFGQEEIYPGRGINYFPLLPVFSNAGHLYIGFNQLIPGKELALLFQLEDKQYSDTTTNLTTIKWSYLADNKWCPFESTQLLSDNTNNLSRSGIAKISVPADINRNNTIMSSELWWIRISTPNNGCITPRVLGIFPNAVTAARILDEAGTSMEKILSIPPLTIKNVQKDMRTIQAIWQLFPSFGGSKAESEKKYYARTSERLRHKQRPVTALDIAQVLLQAFPEILIVKCICAPQQTNGEDISVIVVPRQSDNGLFISTEPKVNLDTLCRIKAFIEPCISPFVKVAIRNPVYERIKVVCSIRFKEQTGHNRNSYLRQLHLDIQKYLCPWLFDPSSHLKVGSTLYKSELLNFINKQSYVDYITGFSLVHFYYSIDPATDAIKAFITDTAVNDLQMINPSIPQAVLIPSQEHHITILETPEYKVAEPLGINALQISNELIIGNDHPVAVKDAPHTNHATDEEMLTISMIPP
ncbi:hypothetical protein [Chitinophaga sp. MM2321]|uniref:hypothetical protein n=1 Tax=Chitinophaga sp. MM2321 TaxID=3137178 RepID=UPI0032D58088